MGSFNNYVDKLRGEGWMGVSRKFTLGYVTESMYSNFQQLSTRGGMGVKIGPRSC